MERDLVDRLIVDLQALRQELEPTQGQHKRPSAPLPATDGAEHAQWLAGILAHSPDIISVLELDGTLLYLNRTAPGTDPSALIGRNSVEFVPESDRTRWLEAVRAAAHGKGPQNVEVESNPYYVWNARIVPIERDGVVISLLTMGRDVTAQRGAEEALALKDEQLRLALGASGMGQWSWDIPEDRLTWDLATKKIFGWPEDVDDIDFAAFLGCVHPADRERARNIVLACAEAGENHELQCRIVLPNASTRWIHSKGRVLREPDGKARTMLGGVLDITQGKRTDEQLQRSAKLEAIGQLAGGIAHDFNNLLVAILGNLDLAETSSDVHEAKQRISDAAQAATQAADLTQQLLVFSRRQPLDQMAVNAHDLLEDILRLLKRLLPETIELELIRAHKLPRVLGDRGQLEQVIVNLCVNARDAMPQGGRLTIETEVVLINGRFRESHPWTRPGRYVLIAVTDTGSGIPQSKLDHVFEPFFTTKETGTGLGLATAYSIVKRHGGLLHVYSEVGQGTTFKIYLPIADRDAGDVGTKVDMPVEGGTETVLLAEDEDAVRAVVTRMLERAGYSVLSATDGQRAVDLYRERGSEISIVLLDAVMPNKGGSEALAEIRQLNPTVPALLCSGYSETPGVWRNSGDHVEFLAKPYEPDALLRVLRRLLNASKTPDASS